MKTNLIKTNELIHHIQENLDNPKKLKDYCSQLEDTCQYIDEAAKYHYLLFLAQIYSSKLKQFEIAQKICKNVVQDPRPSVELQGTLRLAFINALNNKYNFATKTFEQASDLADQKPQLEQIFIQFCQRLFIYSKQCNILQGIKCELEQKYDEALSFYDKQFRQIVGNHQIEHKYFSAKAISQIISIFPHRNLKINSEQCNQFLRELHEQKYEQEDLSQIESLDQNYKAQKCYLTRIVELLKKKQCSLALKGNLKGNQNKFFQDLQRKKLLAIFKIKKVLKTEPELNLNLRQQLKKCLEEIEKNKVKNYSILNQFTAVQNKNIIKINQKISKLLKKNGLAVLKSLVEEKEKQAKRNRFSNFPNQDQSPMKSRTSPLFDYGLKNGKTISLQSEQQDLSQFEGSYLLKVNETSSGYERRYFYFKKNDVQIGKLKLYYCSKKQKISTEDLSYDFKRVMKVDQGKKTKPFKRSECSDFDQKRCFSIIYDDNKSRNFYALEQKDFSKWMQLFKKILSNHDKSLRSQSPFVNTGSKVQSFQNNSSSMSNSGVKRTFQ